MNEVRPADTLCTRGTAWLAWVSMASAGVLILMTAWFYNFYYQGLIGKAQPIPFSHRVHAGDKRIACIFCHSGTPTGQRAGVPPLETCMLCHQKIITEHPEIQNLRRHFDRREPVEWEEIYGLQEFVYFDHHAHIRRQVDCGKCHGNVQRMDRLIQYQEFTMGFCVQCHKDNAISHDCMKCHR